MPTETRLLYIFSDLAYIAKLNPTKKAHEFAISDFHQINGQFLDENSLIEKNIKKLINKLEDGAYQLVLPDFLFTNTMINVAVETEEAVKDYLSDHLLPDLKIDKDDFYLDTSILSNYGGKFKVQLTALEKGVVLPLVKALNTNKSLTISAIAPLSFSIKSLISLEPSVSILQINQELYLAQHYIGVDQCFNTSIDNASDFAETVKTLKGVESSLQTLYLVSDTLVDSKIKEVLMETLPVQQLAEPAAEEDKIPSYIKKIIEAGAKTFSVAEYLLPQFAIDKYYSKELIIEQEQDEIEDRDLLDDNIPKPVVVGEVEEKKLDPESEEVMSDQEQQPEEVSSEEKIEKAEEKQEDAKIDVTPEILPAPKKINLQEVNQSFETSQEEIETMKKDAARQAEEVVTSKVASKKIVEKKEQDKQKDSAEIDLAQFTNLAVDPSVLSKKDLKKTKDKELSMSSVKPIIKNSTEGSGVLKMILIALFSFLVTIAIGFVIGYGVLQLSNRQSPEIDSGSDSNNILDEPEPTPEPELVKINKEDYLLLVVNATTKAGYAGTIANSLEEAGFKEVLAKNAQGNYELGNYLLLSDLGPDQEASNQALLKEIEEITELEWELSDEIAIEDADSSFQAVLVLAE